MIVQLIFIWFSFASVSSSQFKYPNVTRYENITDEYYGIKVHDPYRWLEELNSEALHDFVEKQISVTVEYLYSSNNEIEQLDEVYDKMRDAFSDSYTRYEIFQRFGNKYFNFTRYATGVFYVQDSLHGERRVLLDCNKFDDNSTYVRQYKISPNGEYFAYAICEKGSDWVKIHVKNTTNGVDFPEILGCVKYGYVTWTHDNIGFFYGRFADNICHTTASHSHHKLYYHIVGTNQSDDILVIEFPDKPTYLLSAEITSDGRYLILIIYGSVTENLVYYVDLSEYSQFGITSKLNFVPLVAQLGHQFNFITNKGSMLYFSTSHNVSNNRIIKIDLNRPDPEDWIEIVPEHPTNVIQFAKVINKDKLIIGYLEDVKSKLVVHFLQNGSFFMDIPLGFGTITSKEERDNKLFFEFESFVDPSVMYCIDFQQDPILSIAASKSSKVFDKTKFVTKQVFYPSKDGTNIPMFIVHKKDYVNEGNSPTLMECYGGSKHSMTPNFYPDRLVFIENFDGVFAMPNIRGGGEYGQSWYEAGTYTKKQNSLDDIHSAALYLISENYTNPSKLILEGTSYGAKLVSACINQKPELYGAAFAQAGMMDLLRFQKFTSGRLHCKEIGCSDDGNKTNFENLLRLSPLHNVRLPINESVQYPAVLLTTGLLDDRVAPIHSYKLISELQHTIGKSSRQTNPLLLFVENNVNHGHTNYYVKIHFLMRAIGMNFNP